MTSQKISLDKAEIFSTSLVSRYKNTKAIIEISGKEAINAPKVELRFATSDTRVIKTAELISFIIMYIFRVEYTKFTWLKVICFSFVFSSATFFCTKAGCKIFHARFLLE